MTTKRTAVVYTLRHRWELIALIVILALGIPAIIWVPEKMVQRVYRGDKSRQTADSYAKLVDDYRKTLVQMIGAAFVLYTLHLTQRRTKATEETLRTTQPPQKVSRDTQITDRFTKGIAQLGAADSEGRKQLEIRFGGIYALERIAKDSPGDHLAHHGNSHCLCPVERSLEGIAPGWRRNTRASNKTSRQS